MKRTNLLAVLLFSCLLVVSVSAFAQSQPLPESQTVTRSVAAIGYPVGEGVTKVDFKATELMPQASGQAEVEIKSKSASSNIQVTVRNLPAPSTLGAEFLTYVLWVVTPDGRTGNSGEILLNPKGEGRVKVTSPAQTFTLVVTAEPYFAVRLPSEIVAMYSVLPKGAKGKIYPVNEYRLIKRNQYQKLGNPLALVPDLKTTPLEVYELRNAVDIARSNGAEKYAPEVFAKAIGGLELTEQKLASKAERGAIVSVARQAIQTAEDARALSLEHQEELRIAKERDDAATAAKLEAERKAAEEAAVAKQKADAEAQRQAELAAAKEEVLRMKEKAAEADAQRARDEAEKVRKAAEQLRAQLLEQFNRILATRDTPRGLVVNLGDVLFDTGKYDLRPEAREVLAKLSGIILAHPGLNLQIEGHTDSVGSDELNLKLSEQRANAVREYLVQQKLAQEAVSAKGFGETQPVADNATPSGRQLNRRVEIIVSGEVIGQKVGM